MPEPPAAGAILVDKPAGVSSFGAIARLRRVYGRRLGHTGTLDPFATGLLVVLHGRATRLAPLVGGGAKRYRATVRFGATSTTDDPEGEIAPTGATTDRARLIAALPSQIGDIEQVPPAASAVHVDGERAYRRFRRGEDVTVPPRRVSVHGIDLMRFDADRQTAELDIRCGSGTYVRSIARDLGATLGCGAHLAALRRTEVGPFAVADAAAPDAIAAAPAGAVGWLPPLALVDGLPRLALADDEARDVRHGRAIPDHGLAGAVALVADDALVAVGDAGDGRIAPRIVLEPA